jgi:SAM-dependent methyltransferase
MTTTFDAYDSTYRDEVQSAISFAGKSVDFFTRVKANHLVDLVSRRVGPTSRQRILDIGCGVGLTDQYLAPRFGECWGVDISAKSIERAAAVNTGVRYCVYNGTELPFDDHFFDVSFAICVMHHVNPESWRLFVREMQRVIRPGGLAAVFEHNPFNPLTLLAVNRCPFDADAHLLTVRTTRRLFEMAGLNGIERKYFLFVPWESRPMQGLERMFGWLPVGAQYYVAGGK